MKGIVDQDEWKMKYRDICWCKLCLVCYW